jgi:predicted DNA-binding transcriptional regulator AlpA
MNQEETSKCCSSQNLALAINATQLAEMLCISSRSIWRLNDSGKLPKPIRLGGSVRWNKKEIETWVEAGCPTRKHWEAIKEVNNVR